MASRIEGPDPPFVSREPWVRADVTRWLVIPMRLLREDDGGIMVLSGNAHLATDPNKQDAHFDILAFARTVLGKGTPELLAVTTWARIMAAGGHAESSIAEWCREMGWNERTFYHRFNRAVDRIVEAKNRIDCRSFTLA